MAIHIALLRAINVAGRNMLSMSELRDLVGKLGFVEVRSLLQSGNLVFHGNRQEGTELECLLEVETDKQFGVSVDYMIRTAAEWQELIARNPFPAEAKHDPGHLVVMFMKQRVLRKKVVELQSAIRGPEYLKANDRQLYIVYPAGIGRSKLTNTLIEKKLGVRGTGRNWNTVLKIAAMISK